jgi:hypothetical protein
VECIYAKLGTVSRRFIVVATLNSSLSLVSQPFYVGNLRQDLLTLIGNYPLPAGVIIRSVNDSIGSGALIPADGLRAGPANKT